MKQTEIFTGVIGLLSGVILTYFAMHFMMMWAHHSTHNTHDMKNMFSEMWSDPHAHHAEDDHSQMTMEDMSMMLEGVSGDMLDKMFLEGMIPHHQAAIDMARFLENSDREELRTLWREIIEVQQAEINMMQNWLTEWNL